MVKLSKNKFIEAVVDSGGVKTTIANRLGVTRKAIYDYLIRFPELQVYLEQEEEKILDMAEISLFSQVKDQDFSATKYILGTKGRKRGYSEKQEVEISTSKKEDDPELIKIIYDLPDKVREKIMKLL